MDFPVPPGVRAAAFRALAGMPGVTSIGPTQDELGRPGVGIEIQGPRAGVVLIGGDSPDTARAGNLIRTLIIDPETSRILADQTRIGKRSEPAIDTLILEVGWTNTGPHKPALPGAVPRPGESASA